MATYFWKAISMASPYDGAVIIIPTRNRARLAMRAVKSVLEQPGCDVDVLVSDNSSSEEERGILAEFCSTYGDSRLRYVRPPESLAMTPHWEWALQQALANARRNHFVILTDRMVFKRKQLRPVLKIAERYPSQIVSYHHDRVVDHERPVRVEQHPWSGKPMLVNMVHLSRLYSESTLHPCLPRMLNCVAPRDVLRSVSDRFGSIFGSTSPDYNFGFRCIAAVDEIVFYDASPIVGYALERSNGTSVSRGVKTRDNADFLESLGSPSAPCYAAPAPEVVTVGNCIFHEYALLALQSPSDRFFAIEAVPYLNYLAQELASIEDPGTRAQYYDLLWARGWRGDRHPSPAPRYNVTAPRIRNLRTRLLWELKANRFKPLWTMLWRLTRLTPHDASRFEFHNAEEALDFMNAFPRAPWTVWNWQVDLLRGQELELAE
jgi:glycosyltransferase involved in cell wall biosynthesis